MPWKIIERGGKHCVVNQQSGDTVHCHDTHAEAVAQLRALYANEPDAGKSDTLISFGGSVKALGNGRVGGYLIAFSTPDAPDLEGEFFTKATDFGDPLPERTPVYYHHGWDPAVGKRRLGSGSLKADEVGVWIEAQLNLRDAYEKAIYRLAEAGKLGWSSGTAGHLVEKVAAGKAFALKSWPLGLDASLTPTPVQPHGTGAVALKSWQAPSLEDLLKEETAHSGGVRAEGAIPPEMTAEALKATYDTPSSGLTSYDRVSGAASRHMTAHHAVVMATGSGSLRADDAVAGLNRSSAMLETLASKKKSADEALFDIKSVLVPGLDTEEKAERVVAIVTGFAQLMDEKREARVKSGRRLSQATREAISSVLASLNSLLGDEAAVPDEPAGPAESEQKSHEEAASAPGPVSPLLADYNRFLVKRGQELLASGATT